MFGKLLGNVVRVVTLPVDAVSIAADVVTGGSGSKKSRTNPNDFTPVGDLERIRDRIADTLDELDD